MTREAVVPAQSSGAILLALHGITKRFGDVTALENVSLSLKRNSIHALLGENGAGKTTLMRIAFGMVPPDSGTIEANGIPKRFRSPTDAIAAGIGMVHQQFSLVPAMTVAENVALGGKGRYEFDAIAKRIEEVERRTGLTIDPAAKVRDLTNSERQKLEIVRTLAHDAKVLILDEPTAALTPMDIGELFTQLHVFAEAGGGVVLITHKLRDALEHADEVTVLRRGHVVATGQMAGANHSSLAEAMLGSTSVHTVRFPRARPEGGSVAQLDNVLLSNDHGRITPPISLKVHSGEILGVAALDGAAAPLIRLLAGRIVPRSGTVRIPTHIGFVPENRQEEAMIGEFSLTENVALKDAGDRTGILSWPQLAADAESIVKDFDVRASGVSASARQLSGGSQQRFILGRELRDNPPLLVLENPTQGLDVKAAASVHERMRAARRNGIGIVFYSSDIDELVELADRVFVITGEHVAMSHPDRDEIGALLLGNRPGSSIDV